jgi:hypothetical protein
MIRRIILTAVTTIALAAPALAQTSTMAPAAKSAVTAPAKPAVTKTSAKPASVKITKSVKTAKPVVHHISHKTPVKPVAVKKPTAA